MRSIAAAPCPHPRLPAVAAAVATLVGGSFPAAAQLVTPFGDVSPSFSSAASVDLAGQQIFLGFTTNGARTLGTLDVTAGGSLTAAQIVPGIGGLGEGIVTVSGAGSIINLTGGAAYNGLDIGSWGIGTMTVSNGATVTCSSPLSCSYSSIGNAAGSTGQLRINGGVLSGFGSFAVGLGNFSAGFGSAGASTAATLNIENSGSLSSTGYNVIGANYGQTGQVTGTVTIDGIGSTWSITRDLANNGGQAFLAIAPSSNTIANVTISNGGNLSVTGSRSTPATDSSLPGINMSTAAGATSTMTVESGGSVRIGGDTGVITLGGNSSTSSAGAKATLNIKTGGTVSGTGSNGLTFMAIGQNLGEGTVNVSGVGSQLTVAGVGGQNTQGLDGLGGLIVVGRNRNGGGGGIGTLDVASGGSVLISDNGQAASTGAMGLRLAEGAGSSGTVNVSGSGSSIVVSSTGGIATTPYVEIGTGGIGKMTVSDGGTVLVQGLGQRNFIVGNSSAGSGTLDLTTGAQINASWFAIGNNGGKGTATINNSTVNVDGVVYFNGNPLGAGVRVGRGVGADALLELQNGAALNINNSIADASVILGGTGALAGGTGTLNMSGGSTMSFTGLAANASLQVGGSSGGIGIMSMTGGSIVNVGATGDVTVGGPAGSDGKLDLESGSKATANRINIGGNSDVVTSPPSGTAGGTGRATVTGAGSELRASGSTAFVGVGRSGTGELNVLNGATVAGTAMSVGRGVGGNGTLVVSGGSLIDMRGQQTVVNPVGANLAIGLGEGMGLATITNSTVNIINATPMATSVGANLVIGGSGRFPKGTGTLDLSGSQVTVSAATGLAAVTVGNDGTGTALLRNSSSINAGDGTVYVARQVGSTGTLDMSGNSVLNADFVAVGVNAKYNATSGLQSLGGVGTLALNNSTINTKHFELGAGSTLTGDGGVINVVDTLDPVTGQPVKGPVIIGGTISPGNSPGRIRIRCDVTTLAGSRLILDIDDTGVGFEIDELILGSTSKFDLQTLQIVFNFIGDTNPDEFAKTGGFDLDNFLRAEDPTPQDPTNTTKLSDLFRKNGNNYASWDAAILADNLSAESDYFDLSNFKVGPGGEVRFDATAIPEPASIALVLLALLAMEAQRRRAAARRV
jgi:fibronectin-binding autotransporter adhesin